MKNIRVINKFTWIPHQDQPKHPAIPTPYRKPELRKPLYELRYDGEELYFVNFSDEVLDTVSSGSAGLQTVGDDEVMPVGGPGYCYELVLPNEAVKVEHYDAYYDSDFLLQLILLVKSPSRGILEFRSMGKGQVDVGVLLWDTGEFERKYDYTNKSKKFHLKGGLWVEDCLKKEGATEPLPPVNRKTSYPLGENFGLLQKEDLGSGRTLRVENDDWGYMVAVVDKERNLLFGYKLAVDKKSLKKVMEEARNKVK